MTQAYEASIKYNTNLATRKAAILTTEGQRLQVMRVVVSYLWIHASATEFASFQF